MRIGVFGGSFNPPHLGHLVVAERAREALELDTVLWVPNRRPPHKAEPETAPEHRRRMVELAVHGNPGFLASDIELRRPGLSFTVDTLQELRSSMPGELVLIVGMDSLATFESWRRPDEILRLATLAAYPRLGHSPARVDRNLRSRIELIDAPLFEISSTAIRERIKRGESVRYLLPDAVAEYSRVHSLYAGSGDHDDVS